MSVDMWRLIALLALTVGFTIGLALGGLSQRALDKTLRAVAVRRAITHYLRRYHPACPAVHPAGDEPVVAPGIERRVA
jgi:hypothetical protein